jgi:hypothetical protein
MRNRSIIASPIQEVDCTSIIGYNKFGESKLEADDKPAVRLTTIHACPDYSLRGRKFEPMPVPTKHPTQGTSKALESVEQQRRSNGRDEERG